MLGQLIKWIMVDSSSLGSSLLVSGVSELGRPMMLLNVLQEVCGDDSMRRGKYDNEIKWSIKKIMSHLQVRTCVAMINLNVLSFCCRETSIGCVRMLVMMAVSL